MNYEKSGKILEKVKKAKKILLNVHRSPDPDTVGCALSMMAVLEDMGKEVRIICPDDAKEEYKFLPGSEKIEKVNFMNFDYKNYDLFIVMDSGSWSLVSKNKNSSVFDMKIACIDHHKTNDKFGNINLIDPDLSSCAELLYLVFEDWKVKITKNIATTLLAGILGDTGAFRYPSVTSQTFAVAEALMKKGADKNMLIFDIFGSIEMDTLKFWAEVLNRFKVDEKCKFVWAAVPHDVAKKFENPKAGKETAASAFGQSVAGTDFGIIMVEEREKVLSISLRSRSDFDVSVLAEKLGGGGHKAAAGAKVEGMNFDDAVKHVLTTAQLVYEQSK
jgi:phosphoesterase RecJ-like protein